MGIVRLRSKIHVFFFAALTILVHVFLQIFIADVYFHLTLRFFMVYLCLLVVVFFSLSGFFSRISSSFFSSFCFTASPFLINCFLFARDVQQLFTILSSIYLFICRHRSTLSIWWGQFFWRHLCLVYVKFIVKTTGTLGTMYPREREREKVFRVLVQPPKRTFVHRRSYSLPVLQTPSESV